MEAGHYTNHTRLSAGGENRGGKEEGAVSRKKSVEKRGRGENPETVGSAVFAGGIERRASVERYLP